jgi:rRNA-processing protein EBP2
MTSSHSRTRIFVHVFLPSSHPLSSVTLHGVKQAITQLDDLNVAYKRPVDYYAEMVKSDAHMAKIKDVLLSEHKRIDAVATRKKSIEAKKYAKQVHAAKVQERQKQKKEVMQSYAKLRTGQAGGKEDKKAKKTRKGDKKNDVELFDGSGDKKGKGNQGAAPNGSNLRNNKNGDRGKAEKSKKRKGMDEKYGRGEKKSKKNDAKSVNDTRAFNSAKNNQRPNTGYKEKGRGGVVRGSREGEAPTHRRKKKTTNQRPGKARRAAGR